MTIVSVPARLDFGARRSGEKSEGYNFLMQSCNIGEVVSVSSSKTSREW